MKSSEKRILILEIILILFMLFNIFVLNFLNYLTLSILLGSIFAIIRIFFGKERDNFRNKRDIILTVIIYLISYYLFTYLTGIFFGFVRSGYSTRFTYIIRNMWPTVIYIVTKELLRFQINIKGENKKFILILSCILFILTDVINSLYRFDITDFAKVIEMIEVVVLPSITENVLLTYMTIKAGYKANILYLALLNLPQYLVPIMPDTGMYLDIIFKLIMPCLLLYTLILSFKKKVIETKRNNSILTTITNWILILFLVVVVYLTSGIFKYYALTIGSGSMEPNISKGDLVVIEKTKAFNTFDVDDILVFKKDQKVIVHRIIEIKHDDYDKFIFVTKGDANNAKDAFPISEEEVIGLVRLNIKYAGYPTVWINERMK